MNPLPNKTHQEAVAQFTRLREEEVKARLQQALSPAYWENLNPHLSVHGNAAEQSFEREGLDTQRQNELRDNLARAGYFQTEPLIETAVLGRMIAGIETLRKAGWPPPFAFVYDEFWQVTRGPAMTCLLASVLGPGYQQIRWIFTYYIQPRMGIGATPHTDLDFGAPNQLTVWLSLTDATLANRCIYLIPRDRAARNVSANFHRVESVSIKDVVTLLHNCRAVPVHAGTMLGWGLELIHWGARSSGQATAPRISIVQAFIAENAVRGDPESRLIDAHRLPTFAERLLAISKAIIDHRGDILAMNRYCDFVERLTAELENAARCGHS